MTGLPVGGENKVWVPDTSATTASTTTKPDIPTNHYTTDHTYLSRDGNSATLPNGKVVNAASGETLSLNENGQLVVSRQAPGFDSQDGVSQITTYDANGKPIATKLQQVLPGQDEAIAQGSERSFTYTTEEGFTSTTTAKFQVGIGWVDSGSGELVLGLKEWQAKPDLGSNDNPLHLGGQTTPETTTGQEDGQQPPTPPKIETTPTDYKQIDRDGVTYTVGPNGTLNRSIPGQPGLMELREADGSGYIVDTQAGTKLAVLEPGDHVGGNDSDRIVIFDDAGHAVERATQDAPANVFAPMATTATPTDTATAQIIDAFSNPVVLPSGGVQLADAGTGTVSDAGTGITISSGNGSTDTGSTTNPPVALVDTGTAAPETIATTGSPLPPPTLDVAGLTTDLTFASTLIGLKNWGSQDDLGHLSTLVSLYDQGTALSNSTGALGDLGSFGAGLGVVSALKSGNPISVASSGASFYNSVAASAGWSQIPIPVINLLNVGNALQSGNPVAIASSVAACFPPYGTLVSIGISLIGSLFGSHSPPPPPDGVVHYTWDDSGAIAIHTDQNVSGGGDTAKGTAGGILGMLQSVVDEANTKNHAQGQDGGTNTANTANDLALDPTRLPKVGFTAGMSWIEVTHSDGTTTKETIDSAHLGERLLQVAVANDAVVPAWQVQTMQAHHQAQQQEARQATQQSAQTHAQEVANAVEADGHDTNTNTSNNEGATTSHGPDTSAQGIKGQATESADHKSQTYDALVVHLGNPSAQAHISAIAAAHEANANAATTNTEVLRDIDGDGYFESTQWVSATDAQGNAQGMLVLDANRNGSIETADILHLGGNAAERNSMAWLDSNGDGKLDASDPAFAAIRLWVDVNHNGRMDDGESTGLQGIQLTSIDLKQGTLTYADGQSDTLSTTTLKADTEGVKLDSVKVVGADGKLKDLDAGALVVHEHYDGTKRTVSYELQAKVTGDWEKTADAPAHRHGGGNVAGAPTQTNATGATSVGAVVGKTNVVTATTMDVGDKRITSDAPATTNTNNSANNKPTTITLNAGDARITSNTPQPKPIVFVPAGAREGWITEDGKALLQLPQDGLFSVSGVGGLGALGVVTMGAVQQTAFAQTEPGDAGFTWQSASADAPASVTPTSTTPSLSDAGASTAPATTAGTTIHLEDYAVVRHLHLGVNHVAAQPLPGAHPTYLGESAYYPHPVNQLGLDTPRPYPHPAISTPLSHDGVQQPTPGTLYIAPSHLAPGTPTDTGTTSDTSTAPTDPTTTNPTNPSTSTAPPSTSTTPTIQAPIDTTPTAPTLNSATTADDHLSDPQEDTVLHVSVDTLLANDTNATGIAQVGNAEHGTVVLSGNDVVFMPEANYHGPASFAYVVTGQDGGRAVGVASFNIEAVNDAPVALGETVNTNEDVALTITQATLLANDTDVDIATDGQTLRVSAVGHAAHGTVNLLANGNGGGSITFTPDANFHGTASFDYVVNDGNGGTATATATVQVAAVNDVPVALGETITSTEDTTLLVSQAALLANDTDPDVATDGQLLTISAVSNATHGTVSILGNGQIQFVPVANFNGTATFDYVVSDGHGGTATATATVLVGSTDDAPVAIGETVASQEDQVVTLTAAALLANDTDVDNATSELRISRVAAGTGGTVALNASGNVVFTPTANYNGTATFTYWVKDPDGLESNAATVTLNVAPVNDAPYAQGEVVNGASEDAVFHIDKGILLANDGDVEDPNNMLDLAWVGNATNGTVSLDGSGNVVFTPAPDFNGTATFDYQVRDTGGAVSPTVTAQIPVAAVNDNPVAADESFTMYTNTATSPSVTNIGFNQLLANDTDIDNPHSDLTVSAVRNANNGTVAIVGGLVQFTPTQDFNGTASFQYQVDDQHGGTAWATAFVSVAPPPNLYPSITVTYANFYPTGNTPAGAFDIGQANWTISDDGNSGLASVTYIGGTYHVFGAPGPATSSIPWNVFTPAQTSWYIDVPRSSALDGFDTTWRVVDDRGLQNIWHFGYTAGVGVRSSMDFSGYAPPVVLGLDGNAPHYIETSHSNVRFDLNGDGVADQVAWAAPGSGVLGIDLNGDHQISNANEFTFTQYTPGAKTDLEGLRAFDTNHNGLLDAADAQWGQFGVWEDKNSDGKTDYGEFKSLDQLGIASINLAGNKGTHAPVQVPSTQGDGHLSGVAVVGESSFTRIDGRTGMVHDAMFAFDAERELAEVRRMALQFNQFCNTAQGDHAPLGFVPIAADGHAMALPWVDGVGVHHGARAEDIF